MPRAVNDIDVLQQYIQGVMGRAAHHAGRVDQIALAIVGAIVWRKTGPIRVYEREGRMTNAIWVQIGETRYALSYNHEEEVIEVRRATMQGTVVASFSNATPIAEVKQFFANG